MSVIADATPSRPSLRGPATLLSLAALVALTFFAASAVPYLASSQYNGAQYAGRRPALLVHIAFGTLALLSGPIQLWLGLSDRRMNLHRQLGLAYVVGVAGSASAAYVIAMHPSAGWVFGTGLMGLATAWLVTTTMAFVAIKRQLIEQHKEWMIRSYVVTFAFVFFRVAALAFKAIDPAGELTQVQALAWAAWALPLLVTEAFIQGRKILAVKAV